MSNCPICDTPAHTDRRDVVVDKLFTTNHWTQVGWLCGCGYLWADDDQREANKRASEHAMVKRK